MRSAAFSPDGSRIVTASADQTARIWDAATAKEMLVLRGHEDLVFAAAFSPAGRDRHGIGRPDCPHLGRSFPCDVGREFLVETCTHRLGRLSKLSREEMRLAGYPDSEPEIDVCVGQNQ